MDVMPVGMVKTVGPALKGSIWKISVFSECVEFSLTYVTGHTEIPTHCL